MLYWPSTRKLGTEVAVISDTLPRIAIVSCSERQRINLAQILDRNGLRVVINESPSREFLVRAHEHHAEALLIDMDDDACFDGELLEFILGQEVLPLLINDSAATRMDAGMVAGDWGRRLARKLAAIIAGTRAQSSVSRLVPQPVVAPVIVQRHSALPTAAVHVWVLGASIGGPHASKQFLAALAPGLPLAFILAQHIGTNFIALLARQLDQVSSYRVLPAQSGKVLCRQQVVLAPVDEDIDIDAEGRIQCTPVVDSHALYRPSIDAVLMKIAQRYGNNSGAIIFSGMGNDGVEGARAIAAQGGQVWAQDCASCLVSSMPDRTRMAKVVSFSGTPEALARKLSQRYATPTTTLAALTQEERTA